jgi:adenylate cyclase, class 2
MHWEVEQKFRLGEGNAERALQELGVHFSPVVSQADHYFNHPGRDFAVTDEAFRLRQVGDENFVTYKGPKVDAETKTRRELELPLAAGSEISAQFAALFVALGFRPVATVKKTRRSGMLAWEAHQVEVCLDEVEGVGSFLELEIGADDAGLEAAKAALKSLAQRLDLESAVRSSYLELLLANEAKLTGSMI